MGDRISFDEYQTDAVEMMSEMARKNPLLNSALGLCGESGEYADIIKKNLFQGHDLDKEHLKEELGDILWYIAEACYALDIPMEQVAQKNIEKLHERYGSNKFDKEKSINRKEH
jgi:NTP pyrophosphatase (non-canonical NTP hydrolase)